MVDNRLTSARDDIEAWKETSMHASEDLRDGPGRRVLRRALWHHACSGLAMRYPTARAVKM